MALSLFSPQQGINTILNFVTAKTANGLRRAMLRNNTKHKGFVVYQDIKWNEEKQRWYAWFYVKEGIEQMERIISGGDDGN